MCVFRANSCVTHTVRALLILVNIRQTHTHAEPRTFLIANHVWVLIQRIRSLIELDQHVLALRGFLRMHFVWDCNRHCYYHCCYSGKRIISADYRQLFKKKKHHIPPTLWAYIAARGKEMIKQQQQQQQKSREESVLLASFPPLWYIIALIKDEHFLAIFIP